MADQSEIRYLTAPAIDVKKKKYCRFKKSGIKYIDYKDPEFLKKFLNEQGKIDYHTFKPVLFEFPTYEYFVTGEKAGDCARMDK